MGASQRRKGATGEREVVTLLRDRLGEGFASRRLEQWRSGGDDIQHDLEHRVSIEVKRGKRVQLRAAILQAEASAGDRLPVVAYREDGEKWRFLVVMDADGFCDFLREMDDV